MRKLPFRTAVAALALLGASTANASVFVGGTAYDPGDSFTIFFDGQTGDPPSPVLGLSSSLMLTFDGVDGDGDYLFTWALTNTSDATLHPSVKVTSFGFDTEPDPDIAGSEATGDFTTIDFGSMANGTSVEFCLTGGGSCAGGANNGPGTGETWDGSFVLAFAGGDPGNITLTDFHTRYQSTGLDGEGSATGFETVIPEPGTWAMMLLGFGATGLVIRRARRRKDELLQAA